VTQALHQPRAPLSVRPALERPSQVAERPLDFSIIRRLLQCTRPYGRLRNWLLVLVILRSLQLPTLAWLTAKVISAFAHRRASDRDARRLATLTEREREVLVLVGRGLTNAEIAERLVLGEATIKTHVSNILAKLELRDRIGAVIVAYESGLIEIGERDEPEA